MSDEIKLRVPWGADTAILLVAIAAGIVAAIFIGFGLGATQKGAAHTDEGKPVEIIVK